MNQTKKNVLSGCLAVLLASAGAICSFAAEPAAYETELNYSASENVPVSLDITAVYGKTAKLGSEVPLKIRLYGQSETPFHGTLVVSSLESDNDSGAEMYEYSFPADAAPSETKEMTLYIPLGQKSGRIYLTLKDENNKTMGETSMDFDVSREESRLLIGVLEKRQGTLSWLDGAGLNYGMITAKTIEIPEDGIPEDVRGLEMFDVLAVNGYDCGTMTDAQKNAVMEWVSHGGTLLIGTGKNAEETLKILGTEETKVSTKDPRTIWVGMGAEYTKESPVDSELRLTYTEPVITGAAECMVTDGTPLLKTIKHGMGTIGIYGIDLAELSLFAGKHPSYASYFLGEIFGDNELNKICYYSYGSDTGYWSAQNLVGGGSADRLPNLMMYAGVIAGYLVFVGPGLYLFLRKRGMTRYYGSSVLIVSAASCVVIWGMGFQTRFTSEFCTSATILDAKEDGAEETTFLNIRTPDSSGFSVTVSPDYEVTPLTRSGRYDLTHVEDFSKKRQASIGIRQEETGTVLWSKRSKAFDSRFFQLERMRDLKMQKVDAEVSVFGGKISGYVENRLPVTIENAAIYMYGQVYFLGDLEAGERIELNENDLLVWPVGMTWLLADTVSGSPDRENDTEQEYIENIQKTGLGSYFADRYYASYNGEIRIGGFISPDDAEMETLFSEDQDSRIFYTQAISGSMEKDGEIYRCGQMTEPSVTSGMGASYGNTMIAYGTDPAIVVYDPGTDMEIETYSFLPVSDEFFSDARYSYLRPFTGETSFYNEKTGTYDLVDIRKRDFSREELADYISPDGKITVRYLGGNETENGTSQALPLLMVTGRENGC